MGTGPDQWLEQVFFRQHVRCARAVMSVFGPNLRVCVEVFLGLVAVLATCVVVALHGAGGSENLFFDGYGDGLCVELAKRRGWFVVAPRNGMGFVDCGALVDALAARYAIDREQVFLVGHSMGAMQAMSNASRAPGRYSAVAPIAGGGRVNASPALAKVPFFVSAGARDFGKAGAKRLHEALEAAGEGNVIGEFLSDVAGKKLRDACERSLGLHVLRCYAPAQIWMPYSL